MKIAIYGREFKESFNDAIYRIFERLNKNGVEIYVYAEFMDYIKKSLYFDPLIKGSFDKHEDIKDVDLFFSIGGDGTFLECVSFVRDSNIPIVGINSGRLGFLANISKEEIPTLIDHIISGNYEIEKRTLVKVESTNNMFSDFNYGLNELTVHKKDSGSMITIHVSIDGKHLNTYWADGLIIATPTGSTAYSLSAGGPIVSPETENFIITPLAPHTLTVRPLIVSDNHTYTINVEGRSDEFLATLDYRSETFTAKDIIKISKADFGVNIVKIKEIDFISTLRNKLMWGVDKRN